MNPTPILFISGIDTDVGKTIATGWLAQQFTQQGLRVVTQKLVQTGTQGISTDILTHRQIQGIDLLPEDHEGLTCRYVYPYPCSPHLAAKMIDHEIDLAQINTDTTKLKENFDIVLLEGAGGLMVPINSTYTTLDYIAEQNYPITLVTSGKLGSINHTLLSLDVCQTRGIAIHSLIYNSFPIIDSIIETETQHYLKNYLTKHFPTAEYITMPLID